MSDLGVRRELAPRDELRRGGVALSFGTMSLRRRLVLGLLVLAALALLSADVATYASLRSFLRHRIDSSLTSDHFAIESALRARRPLSADDCRALGPVAPGVFVQLRTAAGRIVCTARIPDFSGASEPRRGSPPPPPREFEPPPRLPATIVLRPPAAGTPDRFRYFTAPATEGGERYRVRASLDPGSHVVLVVARRLDEVEGTLHRLLLVELLVTGAVLVAIALLGLWVVRLGLRPLVQIGETADAIAAGDLTRRVERADERTEVGRLGLALNTMLGAIEVAFRAQAASEERLRRFVADASHELRTPLSAVRAYAELFARGADRRPDDLARAMAGIERETKRMSLLVQDLLLLAHLDEGRPLQLEPVELDQVVREAVEAARTVEPERPIELELEPTVVLGDRDRLRQILDNLLGNVRSHTPPASAARVAVSRRDGNAVIEVEDSGPGMRPEEAEQVFERFYRADPTRSRERGGVGLGLSIVAAVAGAHKGTVSARSAPGQGSVFRVTLPLLDER